MIKPLTELFDRVYVINCLHRKDRLKVLEANFERMGVADFSQVRIFEGVDGKKVEIPPYWTAGGPAWGCYQSHCGVLTDILNSKERCRSVLILEDDVCFNTSSLVETNYIMNHIPPDWDQVYLGGQHGKPPELTVDPLILKAASIHRTHAYGLNEKVFKKFYAYLNKTADFALLPEKRSHVDHYLQLAHEAKKWNTYCPLKWVAGQAAGGSDIAGKAFPRRYWHLVDPKANIFSYKAECYYMGDHAR